MIWETDIHKDSQEIINSGVFILTIIPKFLAENWFLIALT